MFPVKGLKVSADKLKSETGDPAPAATGGRTSAPKAAKKRKRPGRENVTVDNLADMWEKVIEHKPQPRKDNKRQKKEDGSAATNDTPDAATEVQQREPSDRPMKKQKMREKKEKLRELAAQDSSKSVQEDGEEWGGIDDEDAEKASEAATPVKEKGGKKQKKQKDGASKEDATHQQQASGKKAKTEAAAQPPAPAAPAQPKLTPLQASMREKLISARFRHLNETLYTRPSAEAFELFEESPEMFGEYHEGFRRQVEVWPENPVDGYIADIKARAKLRHPPRNPNQPIQASQLPLPILHGTKTCSIVDLGCGDAKLATALQPLARKLHLDIRSFDLQTGGSPLVTRADIANLPVLNNSVDVAIFCLALMGTNWLDFVEEAYRILRWRGELWISEIKSRFTNPSTSKHGGKNKVVAHSVGNRKKTAAHPPGKKSAAAIAAREEEEAANLAALAEHVDEVLPQLQNNETDISAFVDALGKRGFLLNRDLGENAVDMSNKMFVRMHFVKAAPAVKGKCASATAAGAGAEKERKWTDGKGRSVAGPPKKKKFLDDATGGGGGEEEGGNEAAVLKPCVYKIR